MKVKHLALGTLWLAAIFQYSSGDYFLAAIFISCTVAGTAIGAGLLWLMDHWEDEV